MPVLCTASTAAPAARGVLARAPFTNRLPCASAADRSEPARALRIHVDELMYALRAVPAMRLDAEIGERLRQIVPTERCLCVLLDHGCTGLDAIGPRLHGTLSAELRRLYAALIVERDPLLARAAQDGRPLTGTIQEHCAWIRQHTRHTGVIEEWLLRAGANGAQHLAVIPARGWLSRGALFAFFRRRPADPDVLALFYTAQRLAVALELRYRPYTSELRRMRLSARERDVLRAGLRGCADRQIAQQMGVSVDAVRYYFACFKRRAPPALAHLKPRELARVLHELGTL